MKYHKLKLTYVPLKSISTLFLYISFHLYSCSGAMWRCAVHEWCYLCYNTHIPWFTRGTTVFLHRRIHWTRLFCRGWVSLKVFKYFYCYGRHLYPSEIYLMRLNLKFIYVHACMQVGRFQIFSMQTLQKL